MFKEKGYCGENFFQLNNVLLFYKGSLSKSPTAFCIQKHFTAVGKCVIKLLFFYFYVIKIPYKKQFHVAWGKYE